MLKLFTTNYCPNCKLLKNWLDDKGIKYEEVNVDTNFLAKAKMISKGFLGVPLVEKADVLKGGSLEDLKEFCL